jgi:hypothetical protein
MVIKGSHFSDRFVWRARWEWRLLAGAGGGHPALAYRSLACGGRQRHGTVDPEPGNSATTMQVRIVRWKQEDGHERYTAQQDVVASPPIVTIGTGSKQLIRLIKQATVPQGRTGLPHYRR